MKAHCQLIAFFLIALASCGSTRTSNSFISVPVEPSVADAPLEIEPKTDSLVVNKTPKQAAKKNLGPFKVALLLPLNIGPGEYKLDDVFADYYEGVLMGLDSLKSLGMEVIVNVYDTKNDTAVVKKITWKKELEESDVIIGPTFKNGHTMLSKYVKPREIALVSPFSNANMWTDSNHYSMYCTPDDKSYAAALAAHIAKHHPNANLVLVNDNSKEDKDFLWRFKVAARELGLEKWKDVTYQKGSDILPQLQKGDGDTNIIITPTSNEKTAQLLLTNLKNDGGSHVNLLFALESWLNFKNTNYQTYELWEQNHLHILTHYFADDYAKNVIAFKAAYKERFATIPSDFAFRGFDHIVAMGILFMNGKGDNLAESAEEMEVKGLHNTFKFRFNGRALENRSVNIIQFSEYRFQRINK